MGSVGNKKSPIELYSRFIEGENWSAHEASEADKKILDRMFKPADKELTVYKGLAVTASDLENMDNLITSYSSTSVDRLVGIDYANKAYDYDFGDYMPLLATIKIAKGTPIVDTRQTLGTDGMKGYEKEITVGRNVKYTYTNLKKYTDKYGDVFYTVDVEVRRRT